MDDSYVLKFDESKEYEMFFNFHGAQVLWVNTLVPDTFLKAGSEFYSILGDHIDEDGYVKTIFIGDQLPSLSTIFAFMEHNSTPDKVKWSAVAGIEPKNAEVLDRILPVVNYGLRLTAEKDKYEVRLFSNEYKNHLKDVIDWLNDATLNLSPKVSKNSGNEDNEQYNQ